MSGGVALIQGASRGLGLQFCKFLVQSSKCSQVIATCREPQSADALQELKQLHPDLLTIERLDVSSQLAVQQCAQQVALTFDSLDLLINCSAMLHPSGKGETSLREVSAEGLSLALSTNTIGPLLMAKHFVPLLLKGTGTFGAQSTDKSKQHSAILINMSAKVGSITDNGTVDTDLSRPYHKNVPKEKLFSQELSVNYLMKIIDGLSIEQTGKFFSWNGGEIPW
ncbi:uncharacterized protein [Aquarana catesbeiana]|uniref:uncharacterized protein isoform X2 n=1 Tax=Aquarana catesbeiana TaxID=8400 RepID=UPI003CC9F631